MNCRGDDDGCRSAFGATFAGTIIDNIGNPIQDVSVKVSVNGSQPSEIVTTDINGTYSYRWTRHAPLGNIYVVLSKAGYSDFTSDTYIVGEACQDETVQVDAALTP